MKRFALPLSISVILAAWIYPLCEFFFRAGEIAKPASVSALALFVCVKLALALAIIWSLLYANSERLAGLGLRLPDFQQGWLRGVLCGFGIFVVMNFVANPLFSAIFGGGGGTSENIRALFHDPREAPLWIFCAVIGGGFNEELIRAFVLTRFERAFGRKGLIVAVMIDSTVFGMGHLYQGPTAAVTTGLTGVLFAIIFLHRRRVADAMIAHAIVDLLGVAVAYALYS